jgi:hypothetical protein
MKDKKFTHWESFLVQDQLERKFEQEFDCDFSGLSIKDTHNALIEILNSNGIEYTQEVGIFLFDILISL